MSEVMWSAALPKISCSRVSQRRVIFQFRMTPVRAVEAKFISETREKRDPWQIHETCCRWHEGGWDAGLPASRHENAFRRVVTPKLTGETSTLMVTVAARVSQVKHWWKSWWCLWCYFDTNGAANICEKVCLEHRYMMRTRVSTHHTLHLYRPFNGK